MPKEINLPSSLDRLVCKELVSRSKFPILDVIEVLKTISQPHLLKTENDNITISTNGNKDEIKVNNIVAPFSKI